MSLDTLSWTLGLIALSLAAVYQFRNATRGFRRRMKYRLRMRAAEAYWRELKVTPSPRGRLRIIATLTTTPDRIGHLRPVLDSLTRGQTRPPDEIHINIPHRFGRTGQGYEIPGFLSEYGVQVHRCDDLGPGTKFIPTVRRIDPAADVWIMVVDDDVRHLPEAVAELEVAAELNPRAAHGYADNYLYRKWQPGLPVDFLCGFAGFIFHRSFIAPDFESYLERVITNRECFFQDDVYLSNYLALRGIERHRLSTPKVSLVRMERMGCLLEQGAAEGSLALGAGSELNTHHRSVRAMAHLRSVGLAAIYPGPRPERSAYLPGWLRPECSGDMVRLGRPNDGGYVVPLAGIDACDGLLSLGINDDWSLDRDFAGRHPVAPVVCYDPTISLRRFALKAFVSSLAFPFDYLLRRRHAYTRLVHKWSAFSDYRRFFNGKALHRRLWVAFGAGPESRTLDEAIGDSSLSACRAIFLKMDIEGSEFEALADVTPAALSRVALLAVEFHHLSRRFAEFESLCLRLRDEFLVAHVHANNFGDVVQGIPDVIEVVWLRRTLAPTASGPSIVSELGQVNNPRLPDIRIRFAD